MKYFKGFEMNKMNRKVNVFWFRRDLRLADNTGLYYALKSENPVLFVFIFDINILQKLSACDDSRVTFIYKEVQKLKLEIEKHGGSIETFYSEPLHAFKKLTKEFEVNAVYANKDYEPYAIQRDFEIELYLNSKKIEFHLFKDHVIFGENEIVKDNGAPYTVFTPYSKKWKQKLAKTEIPNFPSEKNLWNVFKTVPYSFPKLLDLGFEKSEITVASPEFSENIIAEYASKRDFPAVGGTSRLGVHLRFGTVSIRTLTRCAIRLSEVFLNELIWRNFFIDILWHFPDVANKAFKPKYDRIEWRNNEEEFEKWSKGKTGYPMVDAGMRELNETGFMHNRVRMVVASFLTRHLLIDWRWGEMYFAEKLLDYELASNNGNWQWAAGSGCDAAPYFRIFNPESQRKKFDPKAEYILKWVPEYGTSQYPQPVAEHRFARERALRVYKEALK